MTLATIHTLHTPHTNPHLSHNIHTYLKHTHPSHPFTLPIQTPGLWDPGALLAEPTVHDAVVALLKLLEIEQHHEERSPYRCRYMCERPVLGEGAPY